MYRPMSYRSAAQMILSSDQREFNIVVMPSYRFGTINEVGIHQVADDLQDVENAFNNAERDMFPTVFLYTDDSGLYALIREYYNDTEVNLCDSL